jgi:RNA polymerase sigma-70 factor (ECF subfamily)
MRDPEEAKDITQETFLRAFKAIAKFRGEASVKTWLFRIAINLSRNRYRWWKRRKRDKTVSLDSLVGAAERPLSEIVPSDSLNPEDDVIRKERALSLHDAIGRLPDHFREAIVLCDIQGVAYEEIASILEMNIGTVKSRISRGRERLRKILKDI